MMMIRKRENEEDYEGEEVEECYDYEEIILEKCERGDW